MGLDVANHQHRHGEDRKRRSSCSGTSPGVPRCGCGSPSRSGRSSAPRRGRGSRRQGPPRRGTSASGVAGTCDRDPAIVAPHPLAPRFPAPRRAHRAVRLTSAQDVRPRRKPPMPPGRRRARRRCADIISAVCHLASIRATSRGAHRGVIQHETADPPRRGYGTTLMPSPVRCASLHAMHPPPTRPRTCSSRARCDRVRRRTRGRVRRVRAAPRCRRLRREARVARRKRLPELHDPGLRPPVSRSRHLALGRHVTGPGAVVETRS